MLCLCALAVAYRLATAQSAPPGISLFPDCDKPELLAHGQPVMMFVGAHLGMGVSISKSTAHQVGQPVTLNVWVDNQADTPVGVMTCETLDLFKSRGFEIFDTDGHRILSTEDARTCSTDPAPPDIWVCHRNFPISIPAHTCVTRDDYDFRINLADSYDLPPGEYTIRLQPAWRQMRMRDVCKAGRQSQFHRELGDVAFTVLP